MQWTENLQIYDFFSLKFIFMPKNALHWNETEIEKSETNIEMLKNPHNWSENPQINHYRDMWYETARHICRLRLKR